MGLPAKLRWQCRRGSKELDLLLQDYLEKILLSANQFEMEQFGQLLQLDDAELFDQIQRLLHKQS